MRRINNIETLLKNLEAEDNNWEQIIYDATGIWISNIQGEKIGWTQLVSNCGYIILDWIIDDEQGDDPASISEMIDYLSQDDEQLNVIKDATVNDYKKSDIFWGIYDCLIIPKRESGQREKYYPPVIQADGTAYFCEDDYFIRNFSFEDGTITWDYNLVEYEDNYGETIIDGCSFEQCICAITNDLEELVKSIIDDNEDIEDAYVMFEPDFSKKRAVPTTLEELKSRFDELRIYG